MISEPLILSSRSIFSSVAISFQWVRRSSLSQDPTSVIALQIFTRAFSHTTVFPARVTNSIAIVRNDVDKPTLRYYKPEKTMMSLEEFKEKDLITFEQYKEENINRVKSNDRGSALSKLEESYKRYVSMSYEAYKKRFFPPPNPFIV